MVNQDRRLVLRVLVAGLRARRRAAVSLLVVAAVTVGAAATGPVWARASQETVLHDTLTSASAARTALRVTLRTSADDSTVSDEVLPLRLPLAPRAGSVPGYPTRILDLRRSTQVDSSAGSDPFRVGLEYREGACAHLVVRGRCPRGAGEALVAATSAAEPGVGWRIGSRISSASGDVLRVVGVYRPRSISDPFWSGAGFFRRSVRAQGIQLALGLDPVFVARAQVARQSDSYEASLDYPLDADAVRLDDVAPLQRTIDRVRAALPRGTVGFRTELPSVLSDAHRQGTYVDQAASLVSLELGLLGFVVLFALVGDTIEGRRREIALAKLRGQGVVAVLRFALGELLVVLLAAVPAGLLLAVAAVWALAQVVLPPGTPVLVPAASVLAAGLAFVGAAAAATAACHRVLTRPIVEQWRRTAASSRTSRGSVVVRVVAATVAVAIAAALVALPTGSPAATAVPALLVVAVALLAAGLLSWAARRVVPRSRRSTRIDVFLASRRVARSRTTARTFSLLVVTLGLACFAVGAQSVLAGNRAARSEAELGADRVVPVLSNGTDVVAAVRRADPDGRWAAATATWLPDGGDSVVGTVLAVDAERLPAVAAPVRDGAASTALARSLQASDVPAVVFRGNRMTADITAGAFRGPPSSVQFLLRTSTGEQVEVGAGTLRAGPHRYSAAVPCRQGCELQEFDWPRASSAVGTVSGHVLVTALSARDDGRAVPVSAHLRDRRAWRAAVPTSASGDRVTAGPDGAADTYSSDSGYGGMQAATTPAVLPVVAASGGLADRRPAGGWSVQDIFGTVAPLRIVSRVRLLPTVLGQGVLMDAPSLERAEPGFAQEASWRVWLAADAPPDALRRLTRAGLTTGDPTSVAQREAGYARGGPALAMELLTVLAVAAALLAVGTLFVTANAAARERSYEFAAMRLLGVDGRQIVRAGAIEQLAVLLGAGLLGVPAGLIALLVGLPLVREFATPTPVRLDFLPDVVPIALFTAALVAVAAVVGGATALLVARAARPSRLREADA